MDEEDLLIEELIISGALEIAGIDKNTGQPLYNMTKKMKEVMPELYEEYLDSTNKSIMGLWEKGFVDMNLLEKDPIVMPNIKAYDLYEISKLTVEEVWTLEEIKRLTMPNPDIMEL
jgi:hypothetical protein